MKIEMKIEKSDIFGNQCVACCNRNGIKTIIIKNEWQYAPAITLCEKCRRELGELLMKDGEKNESCV